MFPLALAVALFFSACQPQVEGLVLKDAEGRLWEAEKGLQVFAFMGAECPISINYTLTLKQLADEFSGIPFHLVIPGPLPSDSVLNAFVRRYPMAGRVVLDPQHKLTSALGATITPEVFLWSEGEIIYQGKIDDWAKGLNAKGQGTDKLYLKNAIQARITGKTVEPAKTQAVGCFIEL